MSNDCTGAHSQAGCRTAVMLSIVILAVLGPRVPALDAFATIDEPKWLTRSANFLCALASGEYADTYQSEHPGVTTMWAGAAGILLRFPEYPGSCAGETDRAGYERALADNDLEPLDVLSAGRLFIVLANCLVLVVAFLLARRLLGPLSGLVGILLVAFDPFHVAHSRLLHLDGLLSSLMLLALLGFLAYLRSRRRLDLVISGAAAGLSWLTKAPGLFLLPAVGLAAVAEAVVWHRSESAPGLPAVVSRVVRPLVAWGGIGLAVTVLLWPAMWVQPVEALSNVLAAATGYAGEGHSAAVFFNGSAVSAGRLGASYFYYYPLVYLWRSTPATLLGLIAAGLAVALRRSPLDRPEWRRAVGGLVLFAAVFAILITVATKKGDRYLLPVFAPLDVVAGLGWVSIARWAHERLAGTAPRHTTSIALGAVVALQLLAAAVTFPYYLSYYNPLVGGGSTALGVVQIGWGEGLDQAGRYLAAKSDSDELRVASWYNSGCLSYFFDGSSTRLKAGPDQAQMDFQRVLNSDYAVTYVHQWQLGLPPELLGFLSWQEPEHTIWINGLEYVRIYRPGSVFLAGSEPTAVDATLGEQIALQGFSAPRRQFAPGDAVPVALYWRALGEIEERLKVFVHVVDANGLLVAQNDAEPAGWLRPTVGWQRGETIADMHGVFLPAGLPPGQYEVRVGMYRLSGERLVVTVGGEQIGDSLALGEIAVGP